MRAHRSQSYAGACAAAGENESGDGRARAGHVGGGARAALGSPGGASRSSALLAKVVGSGEFRASQPSSWDKLRGSPLSTTFAKRALEREAR